LSVTLVRLRWYVSQTPKGGKNDMTRAKSLLFVAAAAAVLSAAAAPAARAHPHVWITVESTVLFEQGSIAGIQHKWTFDEFYTAMAIQGLDTNNDGNYDRNELAELAKVNIDGLREFRFFTHIKLADHPLEVDDAQDAYLEYTEVAALGESQPAPAEQGGQTKPGVVGRVQSWFSCEAKGSKPAAKPKVLSLHFKLPLKQPILAEAPGFTFSVSDPTFFIAFELAKDNPITLGQGAPAGCKISVGGSERDTNEAKNLGESFSQLGGQGIGFSFAKPIAVSCEAKP
jgi:ABC-type uncharacterized transport system substrate-binding protein